MHTSYAKGTPLFIKMKDNSIKIGKFKDHKSGKVLLEDGSIIELSLVKAMSIRKLNSCVSTNSKIKINFRKRA